MTTKFTVSCGNNDADYMTESKTVRLGTSGDIKFDTPLKVGSFSQDLNSKAFEVYRYLKPNTLRSCLDNQSYLSKYQRTTQSMRDENALNFVSLCYTDKTQVPDEDMIRILADLQYSCSDVVITPSWFNLIKSEKVVNVDQYIELSKLYLEKASFRNHKPVVGTIPVCIPYVRIKDVLKLYLDSDVTSFIVDFNTRSYNMTWMREFLREITEYKLENESVLGCVNCFPGSMKKSGEPTEALDFLGFAAGFDLIGDNHVSKPSSKNYSGPRSTRMFDEDTFTYSKVVFSDESERNSIRKESICRQIAGMAEVRQTVNESDTLESLLKEKHMDVGVMSPFKQLKHETSSRNSKLDDFFD